MLLVILLQVWHGYGKTLGTFSLAENSLFLQLLIVVKLAVISALHQMALVTIPPEHAVWMCFVSGIFIFHNFIILLFALRKVSLAYGFKPQSLISVFPKPESFQVSKTVENFCVE